MFVIYFIHNRKQRFVITNKTREYEFRKLMQKEMKFLFKKEETRNESVCKKR